ncbi:MAG: FAD-dependent monooxygenase [Bacteroidota bacterium]|nr:FAD-dependent monooxygenase [Bacteroidota bacterium]
MQKTLTIKLLPSEADQPGNIKHSLAGVCGVTEENISGFNIIKRSIDARSRQIWIILSLQVFINEPYAPVQLMLLQLKNVHHATKKVIIVGAGPAGLFAALKLIESGIQPIILERGKDVRARRRDLAILNKKGIVNPESNYCFGEGGAGTYSDGKLYTRSTKRGDVQRILHILVQFGADQKILYDAHPHIGTNKLPEIITNMRKKIIDCGGKILFEKKLIDFTIKNDVVTEIFTADGDSLDGDAVILATGHSARDIYELLQHKKLQLSFKPFALGVRVEHPQALIDAVQYHLTPGPSPSKMERGGLRSSFLPPASYSLAEQVNGKGVFSFCMCPGGIIAPAATNNNEIVINGWSPSKRNNPYANSGIVVNIEEKNVQTFKKHGALAGMYFQQSVEQKAFIAGGGNLVAPAQRLVDFTKNIVSFALPACSYLPGIQAANLGNVLPAFVYQSLKIAFNEFGKKMKGYYTNEAIIVATESRTSSPVKILRDEKSLAHPQLKNLYPCAEGAGYAGGIVSAAMDGEKIAEKIAEVLVVDR